MAVHNPLIIYCQDISQEVVWTDSHPHLKILLVHYPHPNHKYIHLSPKTETVLQCDFSDHFHNCYWEKHCICGLFELLFTSALSVSDLVHTLWACTNTQPSVRCANATQTYQAFVITKLFVSGRYWICYIISTDSCLGLV